MVQDWFDQLPLILAGPILRRTEPDQITVWIALRSPRRVTLKVYDTTLAGMAIGSQRLVGHQSTVAIGTHLHLVAITATPIGRDRLQPGTLYAYDLEFDPLSELASSPTPITATLRIGDNPNHQPPQTLQQALTSNHFPEAAISYFAHQLPTFSLPPDALDQLQIVHGSCRKPHGKGPDMLSVLDDLIQQQAAIPNARPHHLFLTGDQIYGDDVANPLLWLLSDLGDTLLGWEERLPIRSSAQTGPTQVLAKQLPPGQRHAIAEMEGGFTAGLHEQAANANSHLFSFGEYLAMYLVTWSPVLWPASFPRGQAMAASPQAAKYWDRELKAMQRFPQTLWKVRRALANVPTYMIFDDHDISDDWNLNQAWCWRVLGKPLGRQVVQNGLLAYVLMQAWGNTPDQFQDNQPGRLLLAATEIWSASAGTDLQAWEAIARHLGLPPTDPLTGLPQMCSDGDVVILDRAPESLTWNYTIRGNSHEVLVLDTRTWRGYHPNAKPTEPAMLLSPSAFDRQICQPMQPTEPHNRAEAGNFTANLTANLTATIVIAPTNLISLQVIDWVQQWNLKQHKVYRNDVGDAWNIHKAAFATLLASLFEHRDQIIVLSGDIHYSSAVRLDYWFCGDQRHAILAQLTASALKNSEFKTRLIHTKLKSLLPERDRHWIGWNNPLAEQEIPAHKWPTIPIQRTKIPQHPIPPDWHYHIHWIQRQPAQVAWSEHRPHHAQAPWFDQYLGWIKSLWQNRWLQDGNQVVGLNNLGVVRFQKAENNLQAVIQDVYWYAPWKANQIVVSRFHVPLKR
jgi:hypothetical protein